MGVANLANGSWMRLRSSNNFGTRSQNTTISSTAVSNSLGYFSMNRTASTEYRKRQNATSNTITASSDQAILNQNVFLLARNGGSAEFFDTRNFAWFALGRGLSESDDGALRTAVETFQDALSRGVV
jgi:hypothetical protein